MKEELSAHQQTFSDFVRRATDDNEPIDDAVDWALHCLDSYPTDIYLGLDGEAVKAVAFLRPHKNGFQELAVRFIVNEGGEDYLKTMIEKTMERYGSLKVKAVVPVGTPEEVAALELCTNRIGTSVKDVWFRGKALDTMYVEWLSPELTRANEPVAESIDMVPRATVTAEPAPEPAEVPTE